MAAAEVSEIKASTLKTNASIASEGTWRVAVRSIVNLMHISNPLCAMARSRIFKLHRGGNGGGRLKEAGMFRSGPLCEGGAPKYHPPPRVRTYVRPMGK